MIMNFFGPDGFVCSERSPFRKALTIGILIAFFGASCANLGLKPTVHQRELFYRLGQEQQVREISEGYLDRNSNLGLVQENTVKNHGLTLRFDSTGTLRELQHWEHGELRGRTYYFNEDQRVLAIEVYLNGELTRKYDLGTTGSEDLE